MRSKVVTVNGKQVAVKEQQLKVLREEVVPKLLGAMEGVDLQGEVDGLIPLFEKRIAEFFPELSEADIDNAYPSEIEALIEAYIEVNFGGLKKLVKPFLSLIKTGL